MEKPIKLFYSYSHKDEDLRNELEKHLTNLRRSSIIENWHDRKINPGNDWNEKIDANISIADIILFLISVDFISSDYCNSIEVKQAMQRHENKEAICIPIYLRECVITNTPFEKLLGLPRDFHFVTSKLHWDNLDEPFTIIAKEIEKLIKINWENNENTTSTNNSIASMNENESEQEFLTAIKLLLDKEKMLSPSSSDKDIKEYKGLWGKILSKFNLGQEKIDNIPVLLEKYPIELFNTIYSTEILSVQIRNDIENIRNNEKYKWYHRSLIVSSLYLSIINFKKLDQNKVLILIDFIKDEEEKVWQKSLTGLVIALTYRKNSWIRFPLITQRFKSLQVNHKIQDALKIIGFIIENSLFNLYFSSEKIFQIEYFKSNPAHCFIPFYENNKATEYFFENTNVTEPEKVLQGIFDSPIPDLLKYFWCYTEKNRDESLESSNNKKIENYFIHIFRASTLFDPYLQSLNELYAFINFYPTQTKQNVFTQQTTLVETKLKDYLFNEIERHRLVATHYMNSGETSKAISHFQDLIRYKEDDIEALKNLEACLTKIKKYLEAIAILKKIEFYLPNDLENNLEFATVYDLIKDRSKAIEYCKKIENVALKNSSQLSRRGMIWGNSEFNENAINDFNKSIELDPKNGYAYLGRAIVNMNMFSYQKAFDDLQEAEKNDPEDSELYIKRAILFRNQYMYNDALADLNKSIKLKPKNVNAYNERAEYYCSIFKFSEALDDLQKSFDLWPNNVTGLLNRSVVYKSMLDYDKSLADVQTAIDLYPNYVWGYVVKIFYLLDTNKYHEAEELFKNILKMNVETGTLHSAMGLYYMRINRIEDAIKSFTESIHLVPMNFNDYSRRCNCFTKLKDYENAKIDIDNAFKISTKEVKNYINRGIFYLATNNYEEAYIDFEKARDLDSYDFSYYFGFVTYYRLTKNFSKAYKLLEDFKIKNKKEIVDYYKASYYGAFAELTYSQGERETFFLNLEIAFQNGYSVSELDNDVFEINKKNEDFINLVKKYGHKINW